MIRLAYILAASHSGSTLLAMLLGFYPDACTVGELKLSRESLGDLARYRCSCLAFIKTCPFYACLTHLALLDQAAQGKKKKQKVLLLPPVSQLKTRMRQLIWREAVEDVVKHTHEKPVIRRPEKLLAA